MLSVGSRSCPWPDLLPYRSLKNSPLVSKTPPAFPVIPGITLGASAAADKGKASESKSAEKKPKKESTDEDVSAPSVCVAWN